jgi:hypothetical protein
MFRRFLYVLYGRTVGTNDVSRKPMRRAAENCAKDCVSRKDKTSGCIETFSVPVYRYVYPVKTDGCRPRSTLCQDATIPHSSQHTGRNLPVLVDQQSVQPKVFS